MRVTESNSFILSRLQHQELETWQKKKKEKKK
jgi:hypothetical protein